MRLLAVYYREDGEEYLYGLLPENIMTKIHGNFREKFAQTEPFEWVSHSGYVRIRCLGDVKVSHITSEGSEYKY